MLTSSCPACDELWSRYNAAAKAAAALIREKDTALERGDRNLLRSIEARLSQAELARSEARRALQAHTTQAHPASP